MSRALEAARAALGDTRAWLVGGAIRDRLLGRDTEDIDLVVQGDPGRAAAALGSGHGAAFQLSEEFGHWRVVARNGGWQVDIAPLQGESIETDLAQRDLTVNAIAEPLAGGELVDPFGGAGDVERRLLRMVAPAAFDADPLRVLRVARIACELGFEVDDATRAAAREHVAPLAQVAPERVYAELRRIVCAPAPVRGLELMTALGATAVVLPELDELRGVEQTRYHHLDVYDHTLAVVEEVAAWPPTPAARSASWESHWRPSSPSRSATS